MDEIFQEINKISYLEISNCHFNISDVPIDLLSNEKRKEKLSFILDIIYSLKDKINDKFIIDFVFEKNKEEDIPLKVSYYQNILLSFYTFINIYFTERQFILIRFP